MPPARLSCKCGQRRQAVAYDRAHAVCSALRSDRPVLLAASPPDSSILVGSCEYTRWSGNRALTPMASRGPTGTPATMVATALTVIVALALLLYSAAAIAAAGLDWLGITRQPEETNWKGSKIALYRTDGGATSGYGVIVRQERAIFPGVLLVRKIGDLYPCGVLTVASTKEGISVIPPTPQSCTDLQSSRTYTLKPHIYF